MVKQEDLNAWSEISDFYFGIEKNTELDYLEGKINKWKRDRLQAKNSRDWSKAMNDNNPFVKDNPRLKKIADNFFKNDK